MKITLPVFVFALMVVCATVAAQPEESYPDKPLGAHEVKITSLTDWKEKLQQYTGKTVVFPAAVSDVVVKYPAINALAGGGLSVTGTTQSVSLQGFLGSSKMFTGLEWHYDGTKNAFIFNFPWEAKDEQSNADLSKVILTAKPGAASLDDTRHWKLDPWRKAFDGLIGKPENQYIAWMVRWVGERSQGGFAGGRPVENLFAENILDDSGQTHILIFNNHPALVIPSEDIMSYYLFDGNGKIEEAGVLDLGGFSVRSTMLKIGLDDNKSHFLCHDGTTDLVFVVQKSHLILKEKTVSGASVDPKTTAFGHVTLTVDGDGPHWSPVPPVDESP